MFNPRYQITTAVAQALMSIEADRVRFADLPIDVAMLASLRESAKLQATHFSTQIEGNRLTQAQVRTSLAGKNIPGRTRDQREVRNYYRALEEVERLANKKPLAESDIQRLHGFAHEGRNSPTPYRDGQNVIRDSRSGAIVYLPPEARDVHQLMGELARWINRQLKTRELPVPLIAGLAHYQFATIHPYYDGNGRTARLLTTLILHKAGFGLKGIYSLDEYYARNLGGYYNALAVHPHHNYYEGRARADLTPFLDYFCRGMAHAFSAVRARADQAAVRGTTDQSGLLRKLDPRERRLLELFRTRGSASTEEIAAHLELSPRTIQSLSRTWIEKGLLTMQNPSRKNRAYQLAAPYEILLHPPQSPPTESSSL